MTALAEILKERGYVYQHSSETLEEVTNGEKRTVYLGIDPSADSLHVGNLVGLLVLRRFLEDGHKIILLTGGGTGMIGDPGGKSEERNLLDEETVARNTEAVAAQIRNVFGSSDFIEENNARWLKDLNLLEFLRDVGKHFTVNAMVKKDIVRDRLEKESPMSFTEFSYALLQGYDFLHLSEEYGCDVQVGGSDQWSNILSGVEFVRRKTGKTVYAFTWPLLINKATGKKFGKSEAGAVWLDPKKSSTFDFFQFWFNTEDDALEEYLLKMTLLPKNEIEAALELHKRDPKERHGQKLLAREITALVHGKDEAEKVELVSQVLFGNMPLSSLSSDTLLKLRESAPTYEVRGDNTVIDVLVDANLAGSKREAREFVAKNAVELNGVSVTDVERVLIDGDYHEGYALLKRGKQKVCVLMRT